MAGMAETVGLIGLIVLGGLVIAAYSPIMGSVHEDAVTSGLANASTNTSYNTGVGVARGFMGFQEGIIFVAIIILIIVVLLLIFKL